MNLDFYQQNLHLLACTSWSYFLLSPPPLSLQGCELVIALTHMRMPNDRRLAKTVPSIDLILGGHDHHYAVTTVRDTPIVKSGTDFRDFSEITVNVYRGGQPCSFEFNRHTVTINTVL